MKMNEITDINTDTDNDTNVNTNMNTPITSPEVAHVHFEKSNIVQKLFDIEDNKCSQMNKNSNSPSKSSLKFSRIHGSGICSPSGIFGSSSYSNGFDLNDCKESSPLSVS